MLEKKTRYYYMTVFAYHKDILLSNLNIEPRILLFVSIRFFPLEVWKSCIIFFTFSLIKFSLNHKVTEFVQQYGL